MFTREIVISAATAFIALSILMLSMHTIQTNSDFFVPVIASMGASICIMFTTPYSPIARPWAVFGGHVCSALVGVACNQFISNVTLAAATAVALSILVMHLLRCLHPPSSATSLIAILGGAEIHALSWKFCYEVVALNAGIIVLLVLVINQLILGKCYSIRDSSQSTPKNKNTHPTTSCPSLVKQDFEWALTQINARVDFTEEELEDLFEFACAHALKRE